MCLATPCPCGPLQRGGMIYMLDNKYHTVNHSGEAVLSAPVAEF
jgi:hypothetical protein